jgi:hypothetical protein
MAAAVDLHDASACKYAPTPILGGFLFGALLDGLGKVHGGVEQGDVRERLRKVA